LFVSHPPTDKPHKDIRAVRAARRRARLIWLREKQLRAERREALNNPDAAALKPVAVSIRDFKLLTGLSNATIYRRIKDKTLKSVKICGRRLVSFDEVERLRAGE
jgi:hypothetical protein